MLSEYYMLFGVLSIILGFIVLGVVLWVLEKRRRQNFTERAVLFHNLSRENAETLYKLHNDRKIAVTPEVYTRGMRPNTNRVKSIQSDDFYHLIRWIKRLRSAESDEQLKLTVLQVIKEMERRAKSYGLDLLEQKQLFQLANLPENILMHYDVDSK